MNGQFFGDRFTPSKPVVKNEHEADLPLENLEPLPAQVPVDGVMGNEIPVTGNLAHAGPLDMPLAPVVPIDEPSVMEGKVGSAVLEEDTIPYKPTSNAAIVQDWGSKPVVNKPPMVPELVHPDPLATPIVAASAVSTALLSTGESEHFRTQWNEIQGKFVDEPRIAVQQADALVSEVVEKITDMFAKEHSSLESQWNQGTEVSTEDLRKALQRYRSFFNRLVV